MAFHKFNRLIKRTYAPLTALAILMPTVCFCFSGTAQVKTKDAQKDPPWVAKDWTQWSEDDCEAVLGESPWGKALPSKVSGEQLRSALPIRQALLRKAQLDKDYDKMKPDKKLAFDRAHSHDLDPTDHIVIEIWNNGSETRRNIPPTYNDTGDPYYEYPPIAPYSYAQALPVKQAVLRLADGTLIQSTEAAVVHMDSPRKEVQFSFPRTIGGKPLLSPSDSSLTIELGAPLLLDSKTHRIVVRAFQDSGKGYALKIADMMYKGKLEY